MPAGHSARAIGAVYLAHTQVELSRVQMFGGGGRSFQNQRRSVIPADTPGAGSLHPNFVGLRSARLIAQPPGHWFPSHPRRQNPLTCSTDHAGEKSASSVNGNQIPHTGCGVQGVSGTSTRETAEKSWPQCQTCFKDSEHSDSDDEASSSSSSSETPCAPQVG